MISLGTRVMLWDREEKYVLLVNGEVQKIPGLGVVNTQRFTERDWGDVMDMGRKSFRLLKPRLEDVPELIKRGPQIIQPHVGALIAHHCDISCGQKVIEGGAGSGVMSASLCRAVGPAGKVYTYEIREEHLKLATSNMAKLGNRGNWIPIHGDVTRDVSERDVDVFVVDIPEPWNALGMASVCLKKGGYFAAYVPTVNQLQRVYLEMAEHDIMAIKAFENIHRDIVVSESGVRPSFEILGHTGYVAVGLKGSGVKER